MSSGKAIKANEIIRLRTENKRLKDRNEGLAKQVEEGEKPLRTKVDQLEARCKSLSAAVKRADWLNVVVQKADILAEKAHGLIDATGSAATLPPRMQGLNNALKAYEKTKGDADAGS